MRKLCFGSLATVLVKCSAQTTKQKQLIGTLLLCSNEYYDVRDDDGLISALVTGRKNLSDTVTLYLDDQTPKELAQKIQRNLLNMLDPNRYSNIVLAMKAILAEDTDIVDTTPVELVNGFTKAEVIARDTFVLHELIAGVYLYIAKYTKNDKRESSVREITDAFIRSFDARRNEITFVDEYGLKNMDVISSAISDAGTINLLAEEGGQCPCCAKPLQSGQTILIELSTGVDMLFCTGCAAGIQNSAEKKAEFLEVKKQLQSRTEAMEAISANKMADSVREIIEMIGSGEPITESALRMSPLKVEEKISDRMLLRKVKALVIDGMYEMVNEIINQLAAANRLNVRQFERAIKRMYEDAEDSLNSQSDIFNSLVQYLYAKAGQKNYEACEVLISYFVQRCEVFHEIAE